MGEGGEGGEGGERRENRLEDGKPKAYTAVHRQLEPAYSWNDRWTMQLIDVYTVVLEVIRSSYAPSYAVTYVPSISVVCVIKCTAVSSTAEYMSFPSPSKLST